MAQEEISKPKSKASYFIVVGMSTTFLLVMPVIILLFVGKFIDTTFHTGETFLILGIIVGFIGGIANVFRLMKLLQKSKG